MSLSKLSQLPMTGHRYKDQEKSSTDESCRPLFDNSEEWSQRRATSSTRWHLVSIITSSLFLFVAIILFERVIQFERDADAKCIQRHNAYSPALDVVEYKEVQFNGSLDYPSIYRGAPTDELDAAWRRITEVGAFSLPEDDLEKVHQSKVSTTLREESGGGYMAGLEVFHHLHCLNMLRQLTWGDYYFDKEAIYTDRPEILRWHIDHCIEVLRQKLMCDADVGVITYNWVPHRVHPFPNFNAWHQCRNFDKVLDWGYAHEAPNQLDDFVKLPGDIEVAPP